ncbi:MAG TPA: hypothetical protein VFU02_10170 [Polyangiaceae bacterium]|nr:hypothetical protein [Polyangiaceae bacterium]
MLRPSFKLNLATLLLLGPFVAACGGNGEDSLEDNGTSSGSGGSDAGTTATDAGANAGSGGAGEPSEDLPEFEGGDINLSTTGLGGSGGDAESTDTGATDAGSLGSAGASTGEGGAGGANYSYDCGAFSEDAGWHVRDGFRAVIVADESDGLNQPVAATFAEGPFGGLLYVVNQGDNVLRSVDIGTGAVRVVVPTDAWDTAPRLLTTIVWDEHDVFDGSLYVGDQGSNVDNNSRIYRVTAEGEATTFVEGGYGLDDVYGLAFPPPASEYPAGLYVTGDTDGARPDWGRIAGDGTIVEFSEVTGAEGIAFDSTGRYAGALWASRPNGGGYAGDDTVTPIDPMGLAGPALASDLKGIHAVTFAPGGDFGEVMLAASWSTGQLLQIDPAGLVTELAAGLSLTNYDGNILAVSSDGNVLFVADRLAHQVVCIEAI